MPARLINFFRDAWYPALFYFFFLTFLLLLLRLVKRPISLNLIIFLLLFLHLVYGLEFYFRYIYDQTDSYQATLTTHRWFKRHVYDQNQLTQPFLLSKPIQFRDLKDFRQEKAAGVKRIAVIGDSVTYGYGIKEINNRYTNLLETRLRQEGQPAEVYNLSEPGADLPQEKEFFDLAATSGDFDLIVWGFYLNDILASPSARIIEFKNQTLSRRQNPLFNDLLNRSYAFDFFYVRSTLFWSTALKDYLLSYGRLYQDEQTWQEAREKIISIVTNLRKKGKPLAVIIFPLMNFIGPEYPAAPAHERLVQLFSDQGVPVVDLLPVYNQYSPKTLMVNRYDAHPNELGHRLAADELYQLLIADVF